MGFTLICSGSRTIGVFSFLWPTGFDYCLRLLDYGYKCFTSVPKKFTMQAITKDMKTNMAQNKVIPHAVLLSHDAASWMYILMSLNAKHICCLLNVKKNKRHTEAMLQMNFVRWNKPQLQDELGTRLQWLRFAIIPSSRRNITLRHVDSSSSNKEAPQPPLATPKSTPSRFGPSFTKTLSSGVNTHT